MQITGNLRESVEIPLLPSLGKNKIRGKLDYEIAHARPSGKPINGRTNSLGTNIATLVIKKVESNGEIKEMVHYFDHQDYTKTRFPQRARKDGCFYNRVLSGFQIPNSVKNYLRELNDPMIRLALGKYIR